jgi:hypothetical protein
MKEFFFLLYYKITNDVKEVLLWKKIHLFPQNILTLAFVFMLKKLVDFFFCLNSV